jgi:hypothetical protein
MYHNGRVSLKAKSFQARFKSLQKRPYSESIRTFDKSCSTQILSYYTLHDLKYFCSRKNNSIKMKMKARLITSLKIWIVIYPSITLLLFLLGTQLSPLPLYQRTLILTIILVPWMIFAGIPLVEIIIRFLSSKKQGIRG